MLIISTIKDVPITKSLSIIRSIFMIPGIICSAVLASSGVNIVLQNVNTLTKDLNTTSTWTNVTTTVIPLQNPVWTMVHMLFFFVLLIYVIQQILIFFTHHD